MMEFVSFLPVVIKRPPLHTDFASRPEASHQTVESILANFVPGFFDSRLFAVCCPLERNALNCL
jgi:hypothetical protein